MNVPPMPEPTPDCQRFALMLPLLDEAGIDELDAMQARAHLHTCAYCQSERERYARLDRALRLRYGLAAIPVRSTEDIMDFIAEKEPQLKQMPQPPARSRRVWLSRVSAIAGVVAVVVLAVLIFHGRQGEGFGAISGPPQYSFPGVTGSIASISMVSPDEGWALGQTLKTSDGPRPLNEVTFYHYLNGHWTPQQVQTSANFGDAGVSGFNGTISMASSTDGWAVAHNFNSFSVLLHYANGAWQEVKDAPEILTLQAISATSLWAISGEQSNGNPNGVYHFNGTSWQREDLPFTSNILGFKMVSDREGWVMAQEDDGASIFHDLNGQWTLHSRLKQDSAKLPTYFTTFTMLSAQDGWALGQKTATNLLGDTTHVPEQQLLYHYTGGQWKPVDLPVNNDIHTSLEKIVMRSPSDGWIIGVQQSAYFGATTNNFRQQMLLFHYDGHSWQRMPAPQTGLTVSAISDVTFTGDGRGWACGYVGDIPAAQTVQDSDVLAGASPLLLTYDQGQWQIVKG